MRVAPRRGGAAAWGVLARRAVPCVILVGAGAACSGNRPGGEEAEDGAAADSMGAIALGDSATLSRCEPPAGDLPAGARARDLAGEYRLILEVRSGERTGTRETGELRLALWEGPAPEGMGAAPDLYGTATVDLAALGAPDTGDPASTDPRAPGVLVFEYATADEGRAITLRLGSKANQVEFMVIEGSYTALRVRGIGARGFHGVWESGPAPGAGGHFCAERI